MTGAGTEVGRELCLQLHDMGASLVCVDSDLKRAAITARKVSDRGGAAVFYKADVGDKEQVRQVLQQIMNEVTFN